ncbi:MAG: 2OG-Fe(II) oxygenase [Myxococcales bacterium]|nr:2OG-Fe(II) oxygenase [Myxococcales bacterium]
MLRLGAAWDDEPALATAWRAARPFPHLIVDGALADDAVAELLAVVDEEPVWPYEADLFAFEATAPEPTTAELRALRAAWIAALTPRLARITGAAIGRADLRAYAYRPGHYLLPHTDHQAGLDRVLAYAYYLPSPAPPRGGELELYRCEVAADELVVTEPAAVIAPAPNRLVVFAVGTASLHQVREVLDGVRLSLAGWFYP